MADYPVTKKDFTTKINDEDVYEAGHINDVQTELRAVIDFLGTGKAEQLSLMNVLQDYRTGLAATIVSGDTINVPASEMMIDTRGARNTADLTRDLADDITASTDTDYYLFTVDDGDGTFSLEFRTASTAVDGKRKIATVTTNDSDATVIDTIVDDDIPEVVTATGITLGTEQASTSGTAIDFTSIPSGTKRITINLVGVSTNGTSDLIVQIGDSGGVETSGYLGAVWTNNTTVQNNTDGLGITAGTAAANIHHGQIILSLEDSSDFTWTGISQMGISNTPVVHVGGASKSLSAELDRVRITTQGGSDTFDAGVINIQYES